MPIAVYYKPKTAGVQNPLLQYQYATQEHTISYYIMFMFDNLTGKFHEVLYRCPMDPILDWSLLFILTVLELGAQRSSAKLVEHRYIEI